MGLLVQHSNSTITIAKIITLKLMKHRNKTLLLRIHRFQKKYNLFSMRDAIEKKFKQKILFIWSQSKFEIIAISLNNWIHYLKIYICQGECVLSFCKRLPLLVDVRLCSKITMNSIRVHFHLLKVYIYLLNLVNVFSNQTLSSECIHLLIYYWKSLIKKIF